MLMQQIFGRGLLCILLLILASSIEEAFSQTIMHELAGTVFSDDSLTTLSRVSVRNKRTQELTVTNPVGKFNIQVAENDTLLISYVGYISLEVPVAQLEKEKRTSDGRVKIILTTSVYLLKPVSLTVKRAPKLDHQYYQKIFSRPKPTVTSPISALYEVFSGKAKSLRKLEADYYLFEYYKFEMKRFRNALYPEIQDDAEILKVINHCRLSPGFVQSSIDYDFNMAVKECMKTYTGK